MKLEQIFKENPRKVTGLISSLLSENLKSTRSLLELCREHRLLDSQEVINWQDELNRISVDYYNN